MLEIRDLTIEARLRAETQVIVDGLDLTIAPGEIVGVVGESGSGKTTLVRSLIGVLDKNVSVARGSVTFDGRVIVAPGVDETRSVRGGQIGMVFQDATRSLDPLFKVRSQLREVIGAHVRGIDRAEAERRMTEALRRMRVGDPERVLASYPHQLSGGLCQRVAIALAIVTGPKIVLADECTTALDVTTQAEVVELFRDLVAESGAALVFVTHNLMLASELCHRVVVMYAGETAEVGPTERVLSRPHHPYTARLLESIPSWDRDRPLRGIPGQAPRVVAGGAGCRFADRCERAEEGCREGAVPFSEAPDLGGYRCLLPIGLGEAGSRA